MRYGATGILGVLRLYLASRFAGSLGAAQDDSLENLLRRRHTNVKNGLAKQKPNTRILPLI